MTTPLVWTPRAAADAAGRRADECAARLEELQIIAASTDKHLQDAAAALSAARLHAHQARARLAAARSHFARQRRRMGEMALPGSLPKVLSGLRPSDDYLGHARRIAAIAVGFDEVWIRYLAIGGACSSMEIDGYLNGIYSIGAGEQSILDHAIWELENGLT